MINMLVYIITNGITVFILLNYLSERYQRKYNKHLYIVIFVIYLVCITIVNSLNTAILNLIFNFTIFITLDVIGYKKETIADYFRDIIYFFILIFLDSIAYFLAGIIYYPHEKIYIFRNLSASVVLLLSNMVVKKYLFQTEINNLPKKEILIYLIITVFCIFLIYTLSKDYDFLKDQFSKGIIIFIVIGQILIDLMIYYYLNFVGVSYKMNQLTIESNKRLALKNEYYKDLKKNYEENRKIIHDIKNYIDVLDKIYNTYSGKHNSLKSQIIEKLDEQKIKYNSGSEILDIILADKDKKAFDKNIIFQFRMEILDLSFISEIDMITIFGNIYDNAIEANETVNQNKYITTVIYQVNKMLIIRVQNSCNNYMKLSGNVVKSTKSGHSGLGITNIKNAIDKYDGIFNIDIIENRCTVLISIPLK